MLTRQRNRGKSEVRDDGREAEAGGVGESMRVDEGVLMRAEEGLDAKTTGWMTVRVAA